MLYNLYTVLYTAFRVFVIVWCLPSLLTLFTELVRQPHIHVNLVSMLLCIKGASLSTRAYIEDTINLIDVIFKTLGHPYNIGVRCEM